MPYGNKLSHNFNCVKIIETFLLLDNINRCHKNLNHLYNILKSDAIKLSDNEN